MNKRLDGKTAIVTGAGRGIGEAIARELAATGANLVVNYATSAERAQKLAQEMQTEHGVKTLVVQADVTDFDQVGAMVKKALDTFGQIDILVNNSGITRDKTLRKMSKEEWDQVIAVDLTSVFNCTNQVLSHMLDRKSGRIVNISSFVGQAGNLGQTNYAAAKAGIIGFTKALALETARSSITVNAVCPGFTESDMLRNVPENLRQGILEKIPMRRFGKVEEVAACVRFLVTEGDYITGQAIGINGGIYM